MRAGNSAGGRGRVRGPAGAIEMAGRRFTTLATLFEPFPSGRLLEFMRRFVERGGRLIWSGPPPVVTLEGAPAVAAWQDLLGVEYRPGADEGLLAPGKQVSFEGRLGGVAPQIILTDFLVDRIYPVAPRQGTAAAARVKNWTVGAWKGYPGGGTAVFLGYRPRDDQSRSLGYEARNWFEVLSVLGAYPPTGRFAGVNDSTEHVSRTTPYLACRFPNGAVALAPHLREIEEGWPGGFVRDEEADRRYVEEHPLPPDEIDLRNFKVNGHEVTYRGARAVSFRVNAKGELLAFAGSGSSEITIDGRRTVFANRPLERILWAPVAEARRVPGGAVWQVSVAGQGEVRIPAAGLPEALVLMAEGAKPGSRGRAVPSRRENGALVFAAAPETNNRWIYAVPGK